MSETIQNAGALDVVHVELWAGVVKLGSTTTLTVGGSRPDGCCERLTLRPGLGIEALYHPRGRPSLRVLVPLNNIRLIELAQDPTP